jgi:predicted flap endonuclease-1-like 5' DNA nuclease
LAKALTPAAPIVAPSISLLKEQPKASVPQVKPRRIAKEKAVPRLTAIGIPAAVGPANDLLQIKGVGPKLNALLNTLGVSRFDQIAAWKAKDISKVDAKLGAFQGRIIRDNWIDQAGLLATGKISTFESRYGKLDSENQ